MNTLYLSPKGLSVVPAVVPADRIIVFLNAGKPLSGALNQWPASMGGGKYMHFYRGNCAGALPYSFATIDQAVEAINKVENANRSARLFIGNLLIATMKDGQLEMLDKPVKQLL